MLLSLAIIKAVVRLSEILAKFFAAGFDVVHV